MDFAWSAKDSPYFWLTFGILAFDAVEQRIRTGTFRFLWGGPFWTYALYHLALGVIALLLLPGDITKPVWAGLLAAVSTETIISNADIKFGTQPLLPLSDQFVRLRAKIEAELATRQETSMLGLRDRLAGLPVDKLEKAWIAVFTDPANPAATQAKLREIQDTITNLQIRQTAMAAQMVLEKPVYVRANLDDWRL